MADEADDKPPTGDDTMDNILPMIDLDNLRWVARPALVGRYVALTDGTIALRDDLATQAVMGTGGVYRAMTGSAG